MSFPLFRATAKSNWLVGVIIFAVMAMYLSVIISMYDPKGADAMNAMLATLPKEMVAAMGFKTVGSNLVGFLGGYYYGFLIVMFPLIYCIIVANRMVAMHVDRGSMAYLLSTPNTRLRIVTTQALYLIVSITVLFALLTAVGVGLSEGMFPGELNTGKYLVLNLFAWLLFCAISGICFFFSCISNETKNALAFGAGIPILFWVIDMVANVGAKYDWLRYLTLFTLFNPEEILAGGSSLGWVALLLAGLAAALYGGGVAIFNRRDLPL